MDRQYSRARPGYGEDLSEQRRSSTTSSGPNSAKDLTAGMRAVPWHSDHLLSYTEFLKFMRNLEESVKPSAENVAPVSFVDFFGKGNGQADKSTAGRSYSMGPHVFRPAHFSYPTYCDHCGDFVINTVGFNGSKCAECGYCVHIRCEAVVVGRCEPGGFVYVENTPSGDSLEDADSGSSCGANAPMSSRGPEPTIPPRIKANAKDKKPTTETIQARGHSFVNIYLRTLSFCGVCDAFIWGVQKTQQCAYQCQKCKLKCHQTCCVRAKECERDVPAANSPETQRPDLRNGTLSRPRGDSLEPPVNSFDRHYVIVTVLAAGNFGVVSLCRSRADNSEWAVKVVNKRRFMLRAKVLESLQKEVTVLKQVTHPGIVNVRDCYETEDMLEIVMELVDGGDLLDYILNKDAKYVAEREARLIYYQLLQAVEYLHAHRIAHRDLKPENILLRRSKTAADKSLDPPQPVTTKIADFGFATITIEMANMTTKVGTPAYLAPEVLKGQQGYDWGVDMWSMGVILYFMLSGALPFENDSPRGPEPWRQALRFDAPPWPQVSESAKDIVRRLLCVDPARRLNVRQALDHPWLGEDYVRHMFPRQDVYTMGPPLQAPPPWDAPTAKPGSMTGSISHSLPVRRQSAAEGEAQGGPARRMLSNARLHFTHTTDH